ncbi:hypothetical protein LDENG_00126310, partial [Lucifuga dentata]
GTPRCSQVSWEIQSLQRVLGLPRGLFPVGRAWKTSLGRRPGDILTRCPNEPPQLTPFDAKEQQFYSYSLPNVQASHPVPESEPRHPMEEPHFRRLYLRSYPFGHYPKLMTIGEDRNVD